VILELVLYNAGLPNVFCENTTGQFFIVRGYCQKKRIYEATECTGKDEHRTFNVQHRMLNEKEKKNDERRTIE
jgi:hypothetical protein